MIKVGWPVNAAVAVASAFGNTLTGDVTVVTMKTLEKMIRGSGKKGIIT